MSYFWIKDFGDIKYIKVKKYKRHAATYNHLHTNKDTTKF